MNWGKTFAEIKNQKKDKEFSQEYQKKETEFNLENE